MVDDLAGTFVAIFLTGACLQLGVPYVAGAFGVIASIMLAVTLLNWLEGN